MDNMEHIDDYFKGSPTEKEKREFEERVINEPSFAEQVAFYISAKAALRGQLLETRKQQFRRLYDEQKMVAVRRHPNRKIMRYMAAACLLAAVVALSWLFSTGKHSPVRLADAYISRNFTSINTTMGKQDSLQMGIGEYNKGNFPAALTTFKAILRNRPGNSAATRYAGITLLRMQQYDEALNYFSALEADTAQYSNPGKLYRAITLLKRNRTGDEAEAKALLKEVKDKDLEGSSDAAKLLEDL
jgi:tetratricopeptide (TPR) repeat protein